MEKTNTQLKNPLVLFDGYCHLCDGSVRFILKHEQGQNLRFTPLQGDTFQTIKTRIPFEPIPDSILFFEDGKWYAESDAALQIAKYLKRPYRWLFYFRFIPKFIRNSIYRIIARYRFAWFGKRGTCTVPHEGERERFLT